MIHYETKRFYFTVSPTFFIYVIKEKNNFFGECLTDLTDFLPPLWKAIQYLSFVCVRVQITKKIFLLTYVEYLQGTKRHLTLRPTL